MAISTYAAIDVGSSELSMKIYEISKAKGIRELSHIRHTLSLGTETYSNGVISYQTTEEICTTLNDFKRFLAEYNVTECQLCGTSALREAKNSLVVLDQIEIQTGFNVRVLSNSESRFLYYKALALKEKNFEELIENGTLIMDIGAGSIQLSLFHKGRLCVTQNLLLGSSRIQQLLQVMQEEAYDFHALIDEYIEKDLSNFTKLYLDSIKIQSIIVLGGMIPEIYSQMNHKWDEDKCSKMLQNGKIFQALDRTHARQIAPAILLCRKISQLTGCSDIHFSPIDFCDSIAADYAERKYKLLSSHDFTKDIISASENIARKYKVDMQHIENVQTLALQIFDKIRKLHGLGKRERLLLQISVILHSCGLYIDSIESRECSYRIIMSTEIMGLSHKERVMVAHIVRYNSTAVPPQEELKDEFSKEEYITMVKLNAILRTANVLDKSNRHKIKNVGVTLKDGIMTITADTMADITLEKGLFHRKADIFQEVFGIRPLIKQKRSGKRK